MVNSEKYHAKAIFLTMSIHSVVQVDEAVLKNILRHHCNLQGKQIAIKFINMF